MPPEVSLNPYIETPVLDKTANSTSSTSSENVTSPQGTNAAENGLMDSNFDGDVITVGISEADNQAIEAAQGRIEQVEMQLQDAFDKIIELKTELDKLIAETSQLNNALITAKDSEERRKITSQLQSLTGEKTSLNGKIMTATLNYEMLQYERNNKIQEYNLAVDVANFNMQTEYQRLLEENIGINVDGIQQSGSNSPVNGKVDISNTDASQWAQSLLATAAGEIGVKETRDNDSDRIAQYRGYATANPWCASFVSWCMAQTFGSSNPLKHTEAVQGIMDQAKAAGVYALKENYTPKPGDIIIFKSNGASHTGIVTKVENGRVYTIEGNTSDQVKNRDYALGHNTITGYVKTDEWVNQKKNKA